ncbi:N-acylamino acid aminohydrolase [Blastocladiella britannica]|nr:N-acylamino acid aminohydrolase [Blastocladiella britannica]
MTLPKPDTVASDLHEPRSVTLFREYLRCVTVQPEPDYASSTAFLRELAAEVGLECAVHEPVAGKPIVVMTWRGSEPQLKSIVLNSHVDVVPVFREFWTQDPFAANKVDGKIYARGAQDMKCVSIQHIEALRTLKLRGYIPRRTLHVLLVPDEEIGGVDGMQKAIEAPWWRDLHAGLVLDEGLAAPENQYMVYHGERAPWWIKIVVEGETGHGSQFIENTVGPKVERILAKVNAFRAEQEHKLKAEALDLGDVTTANMTMLTAGVQYNVIPRTAEIGFDIRVSPRVPLKEFRTVVDAWVADEEGVSWEFVQETAQNFITPLASNPWYAAIVDAAKAHGVPIKPTIFPAATDSRYVRKARVPAFGVSPMRNTPVLLHCHDEYLEESVFVEGIKFFEELIPRLDQVKGADAEDSEKWTLEC